MPKKEIIAAGGQAVIEGVLMRSKDRYAVAVRLPNDKIKVMKKKIKPRSKAMKIPFYRGLLMMVDSISLGSKALNWSADQQIKYEEEQERKEKAKADRKAGKKLSKKEKEKIKKAKLKAKNKKESKGMSTFILVLTFILAIAFAIGLFKLLPLWFADLFNTFIAKVGTFTYNLIDGAFKIIIFILYLLVISLMKDVKALFKYHGAEHMAVHCYEAGKKLTVKNVKKHSTRHERCGSAFLLVVIFVSILLYMFINKEWNFWLKLGLRLALLPVIAGISYEFLRLSSKYKNIWILRFFSLPGLWVQKITTKKPTDKQIEVAIRSLKEVVD